MKILLPVFCVLILTACNGPKSAGPLKRYRLDHWGYFCVDEPNRTIYVAAVSAEHPLYAYRF
jgi:hypothetical protein